MKMSDMSELVSCWIVFYRDAVSLFSGVKAFFFFFFFLGKQGVEICDILSFDLRLDLYKGL